MKKYVQADSLLLVKSGSDYFSKLNEIIRQAQSSLYLQTYIFEADETGKKVLEALRDAAARGVKVQVMVDAFGSYPFPGEEEFALLKAGVSFRLFAPFFSSEARSMGRRLHHKIAVADGCTGLVGGINISGKYDCRANEEPWLDFAILINGEVCRYLELVCDHFYKKKKQFRLGNFEKQLTLARRNEPRQVRFRRNDWVRNSIEIHRSYLEGIMLAKKELIIVGGYFLPGVRFRNLLAQASKRGVRISVLMAGPSDVRTFRAAERYLYDFYLRHQISLFEWRNSMMHGKAMVADGKWCTIGSYNLNFLSRYQSVELNADVLDEEFCTLFSEHVKDIVYNRCTLIDLESQKKNYNAAKQLFMWTSYHVYRLIRGLLVFSGTRSRQQQN